MVAGAAPRFYAPPAAWHRIRRTILNTLNPDLVRALVRAHFPDVRADSVVWLGAGCDSQAYDVDGEHVFRFPNRDDVEAQLMTEMRLLPLLERTAPLAIPAIRHFGVPSPEFPRHFIGYERIAGEPAIGIDFDVASLAGTAPVLGAFLSWLHAFDVAEATALGVPDDDDGALLAEWQSGALDDLDNVRHVAPAAPLERWRAYIEAAPPVDAATPPRRVLLHGDLAAEHILCEPTSRRITGVIDWSEVAIGCPSRDVAGLFHWGGAGFVRAVLEHYDAPLDDALLERARYLAACRGAADITFGVETDRREYVDAGLRALSRCAGPP